MCWGKAVLKRNFSILKFSVSNIKKRPKSWGHCWDPNPLKDKDVDPPSEQFYYCSVLGRVLCYSALVSKINLPSCEFTNFSSLLLQSEPHPNLAAYNIFFSLLILWSSCVDWPACDVIWGVAGVPIPTGHGPLHVVWASPSMGARFQEEGRKTRSPGRPGLELLNALLQESVSSADTEPAQIQGGAGDKNTPPVGESAKEVVAKLNLP